MKTTRHESMDMNITNVLLWNIGGVKTLTYLDIDELRDCEVLCLVETWHQTDFTNFSLPDLFPFFAQSTAIKEKSKGRASGGILVLSRYKPSIIEITNLWITVKILDVVIVTVYIRPNLDDDQVIEMLAEHVDGLNEKENHSKIIIVGDFNVRVADLEEVDIDILPISMQPKRTLLDVLSNRRGKKVNETIRLYLYINGDTRDSRVLRGLRRYR